MKNLKHEIKKEGITTGKPVVTIELDEQASNVNNKDLWNLIKTYPSKHLLIKNPNLNQQREMISFLNQEHEHYIELETTPQTMPDYLLRSKIHQWNVNVEGRINPEVMRHYTHTTNAWFNFKIKNAKQLKQALQTIQQYNIPNEKVILTPTSKKIKKQVINQCKNNNYTYGHVLNEEE